MNKTVGTVYLVGSGPGDPGLITVRGYALLQRCDAVVYDSLASHELVLSAPDDIDRIYVGKRACEHTMPQDEINLLLVTLARAGKDVVRLKGGDPFVFGRGGEEAVCLREHGIPFEVVPGVTSGVAGPAYVGIPTTDRERASFVIFVTGHKAAEKELSSVNWEWVAGAQNGTIVIYMGVKELPAIVDTLIANGMDPSTPAAAIERGTFPTQRLVRATLSELTEAVMRAGIKPPSLFVIGETVELAATLSWMERKPLCGVRVMVTRPADQAGFMYEQLRELGAEVLAFPTIATRETRSPQTWQQMKELCAQTRWLVFTSENGVRYFMEQWHEEIGDVRGLAAYKIAAVGTGTVRALQLYHLQADFVPTKATTAELARQMSEQISLAGSTVVRVRGNLGDDRVEAALRKTGATVVPLPCYETYHPAWTTESKARLFEYLPDAIIFTSGSTAQGLAQELTAAEVQTLINGATIVSIGPSTSDMIRELGIPVTIEAAVHSVPAIIEELVTHHGRSPIKRQI